MADAMAKVREFTKTTLSDLIGDAAFRVYRFPEEDRDVADEARLSLVVFDFGLDGLGG